MPEQVAIEPGRVFYGDPQSGYWIFTNEYDPKTRSLKTVWVSAKEYAAKNWFEIYKPISLKG